MGLNDTVSAERVQIGFFGMRNAGKSSVVNAVAGQNLSVVSEVAGTTTDPVRKAMELLPLGPVVLIDTPGIDDEGQLGELRVVRARRVLATVDAAVLVADAVTGLRDADRTLIAEFERRKVPYLIALNKSDLVQTPSAPDERTLYVSARTGSGIEALKERMARLIPTEGDGRRIIADLLRPKDTVVLVVPIDSSAPKGRLILPQQQTIRDILDAGAIPLEARDTELADALRALRNPPRMVVTDSQAFGKVAGIVPLEIPLTSFSILFARYKGDLAEAVRGAAMLDRIQDGDRILISEGCTHHRQCEDIGTIKLPGWIRGYTGKTPEFAFTSGGEFPDDLSPYRLVVHCGACMLNEREMQSRIRWARECGVPITNYGIAIAQMHGILRRAVQPFPEIAALLQ